MYISVSNVLINTFFCLLDLHVEFVTFASDMLVRVAILIQIFNDFVHIALVSIDVPGKCVKNFYTYNSATQRSLAT